MRAGVIYKYEAPSGKVYIGQTINEALRKSQHKSQAKKTRQGYTFIYKEEGGIF